MANFKLMRTLTSITLAAPLVMFANWSAAEDVNNNFTYVTTGELVSGWSAVIGDPENWWVPLTELNGKSGANKLTVKSAEFKKRGDAFKLTWAPRKDIYAQFSLNGNPVNLSSFENTGALVIDMRVINAPDKTVNLNMRCGEKCEGKIDISQGLKGMKKDQWMALPIALNCFSKAGVDLSKVTTPFEISTEGKLTIEITNIGLQKLGPDDTNCAKAE